MCLPSIAPMHFKNCHVCLYLAATVFHLSPVGSGIATGLSFFHIASQTSSAISRTALNPNLLLNTSKRTACRQKSRANSLSSVLTALWSRVFCFCMSFLTSPCKKSNPSLIVRKYPWSRFGSFRHSWTNRWNSSDSSLFYLSHGSMLILIFYFLYWEL